MTGWQIAGLAYLAMGTAMVWIVLPELDKDEPEKLRREWLEALVAAVVVAVIWLPGLIAWHLIGRRK